MRQKNIIHKKTLKTLAGFALIEVMFSIFLLSTGILATLTLINNSIIVSMDARNQLIAVELAQEGVELVRNVRDNNWQAGNLTFDGFPINPAGNCRIDKNSTGAITAGCAIPGSAAYKLYIKNNFYVHDSVAAVATKFQRKIIIGALVSGSRRVASVVQWNNTVPNGAFINLPDCNAAHKCAYTEVTLSEWGGN